MILADLVTTGFLRQWGPLDQRVRVLEREKILIDVAASHRWAVKEQKVVFFFLSSHLFSYAFCYSPQNREIIRTDSVNFQLNVCLSCRLSVKGN